MEGRCPLVAGLGELYVESLVGWVSFLCVCVYSAWGPATSSVAHGSFLMFSSLCFLEILIYNGLLQRLV